MEGCVWMEGVMEGWCDGGMCMLCVGVEGCDVCGGMVYTHSRAQDCASEPLR